MLPTPGTSQLAISPDLEPCHSLDAAELCNSLSFVISTNLMGSFLTGVGKAWPLSSELSSEEKLSAVSNACVAQDSALRKYDDSGADSSRNRGCELVSICSLQNAGAALAQLSEATYRQCGSSLATSTVTDRVLLISFSAISSRFLKGLDTFCLAPVICCGGATIRHR